MKRTKSTNNQTIRPKQKQQKQHQKVKKTPFGVILVLTETQGGHHECTYYHATLRQNT